MIRRSVSSVLIVLLVLAPTFCQGHLHEAALGADDEASNGSPFQYVPPHFHAHHAWFLSIFDSDDDDDDDSDHSPDDHDALPGQSIAAIFAGQSIHSSKLLDSDVAVSPGFGMELPQMASMPIARSLAPLDHFIPASDRPIYLCTLALRL